ncbi:hypothetical protein GA0115253_1066526 [Streptomyces sp. Termitarium-T10T-6]|nr:hypothetical protein GA0115253_1066526 [Streptomyces sp. Termitarium-T10T-6]
MGEAAARAGGGDRGLGDDGAGLRRRSLTRRRARRRAAVFAPFSPLPASAASAFAPSAPPSSSASFLSMSTGLGRLPSSSGASMPPKNPGTAVPSSKGPGSRRHQSVASPAAPCWSWPSMCGADGSGQARTGTSSSGASSGAGPGRGTAAAAAPPAAPVRPSGTSSASRSRRDAPRPNPAFGFRRPVASRPSSAWGPARPASLGSLRSSPLRGRGSPRRCGSPLPGPLPADGSGTVPSPDRAAAATSSSGLPSLPMMRRTAAGESAPSVVRRRSISPRSVETSRIRAPDESCCC